jgi:hypothetical protein
MDVDKFLYDLDGRRELGPIATQYVTKGRVNGLPSLFEPAVSSSLLPRSDPRDGDQVFTAG